MKLGFIGTGIITEAIVTGLLASDSRANEFILSQRSVDISTRLALADERVRVTSDNQTIVDDADIVFLAVRPQVAKDVIQPLRFRNGQQVASLIATVPAETLQDWIDKPVKITRAIPLPAVANQRGVTAIFPAHGELEVLFGDLGAVVCAESLDEFDAYAAASALMGLYFGMLEGAANWLCAQGPAMASTQRYLTGVFLELARTADSALNKDYSDLRTEHSTPNGLNQQMFEVFTAHGGIYALETALDSVATRVREARQTRTSKQTKRKHAQEI